MLASERYPRKTREIRNHHIDSTIWNDFIYRDDDIVVASYAKAGTTWVQQIIAQLLFDGDGNVEVAAVSPWIDLRIPSKTIKLAQVEAQAHRRFVKTHLPVEALVFSATAKYIYIGRDGRDIVRSMHHHHRHASETWYVGLNDTPGRVGPPIDRPEEAFDVYFSDWLERDGYPFWPFWENVRSWWQARLLPNVLLIHYSDLKRDLPAMIRMIAGFLGIEIEQRYRKRILAHCSFAYMKSHADKCAPFNGAMWQGGAKTFFRGGVNGCWREILPADMVSAYRRSAERELGRDCADWLERGGPAPRASDSSRCKKGDRARMLE